MPGFLSSYGTSLMDRIEVTVSEELLDSARYTAAHVHFRDGTADLKSRGVYVSNILECERLQRWLLC